MDKKYFEFLLRRTLFCKLLLPQLWDVLTGGERTDLLLHFANHNAVLPKDLQPKACTDSNPIVRMLAVRCSYISEEDTPDLHTKLTNDDSPFVRAAMNSSLTVDGRDLKPLSHLERLGVIAMAGSVEGKSFSEFLVKSLKDQSISEHEASEVIMELVRNPNQVRLRNFYELDAMDHYGIMTDFRSIWALTSCTPYKVHRWIAEEYPFSPYSRHESDRSHNDVNDEILDNMSQEGLESVAHRQYEPLLDKMRAFPNKYANSIHEAARFGAELNQQEYYGESEVAALRDELDKFRAEIRESMGLLTEQITEALTRRRGLFG